ncbi:MULTISPECIES: TetR/AcrR family transcriptional regulator [Myxococcus]|uniref:TetR family transcriptional regulator n=1 Tax=Myxococcus xanthus TaxID=34 RepID=A0AAE6KQ54_MYXXA|nr:MULTISPECIES: TetR/AcrR family transcriptional regulator [Myxococcus]QDE65590.1 TetR family transcriptional regulator [Myxococcus xanthus]QDE72863.1 TetR family transcriptional regulator [Myxococcus xanthus]QDE80142.1 TetR family transcriptional regulator [Myxococcus xanthus]WAM26596.1 TetR/AcrR family transcriptional regulator [Myxococcus sp. NMCA1]
MTSAHQRKKQPDVIRAQLLRAAAELVTQGGTQAVTLEAVAAHAGVTKGGLQHHFKSKQLLLDALFDEMNQQFIESFHANIADDPDAHGREARAYLRAMVSSPANPEQIRGLRALIGSMMVEPDLRERWNCSWQEDLQLKSGEVSPQDINSLICRLAADGLWLADLLEDQGIGPEVRAAVIRRLEELTRE